MPNTPRVSFTIETPEEARRTATRNRLRRFAIVAAGIALALAPTPIRSCSPWATDAQPDNVYVCTHDAAKC